MHINNSKFWVDSDGVVPPTGTIITIEDVQQQIWLPKRADFLEYCMQKMSNSGGSVTVQPEHCLIGSAGMTIEPSINAAINEWVEQRMLNIVVLEKIHTKEHSSDMRTTMDSQSQITSDNDANR